MKTFDLTLSVHSSLGTLLAADTLFGHICWGIRYSQGTDALEQFLQSFQTNEPALLISDPYPSGFWPMPLIPNPSPPEDKKLQGLLKQLSRSELRNRLPEAPIANNKSPAKLTDYEVFDLVKWLYKLQWIPEELLGSLITKVSKYNILGSFIQNGCGDPEMPKEAMIAHNTINRLTGTTTGGGGFYTTRELHIKPEQPVNFHCLAASEAFTADEIMTIFKNALSGGYGKYKSKGKGNVKPTDIKETTLPVADNPNAVMLLGPCVPNPEDPVEGFWQVYTKFGKLGGHWATGAGPTGQHNPFKKPVTLLQTGSVLKTDTPEMFYGRLVDDVHVDFKQVRHYGITLAMPIRIAQED